MPVSKRIRRRARAETDFKRQWPARKIAQIANLALLGYTSRQIARALDDGTSPESIRHQLATWGVFDRSPGDARKRIAVRMHPKAIIEARKLAESIGIPLEVWAGRILEFAARDAMYDSIVDGEREAYEG